MADPIDHSRETPESLAAKLKELGFTPWAFAALWGVRPNSMKKWLMPEGAPGSVEPPYWITVALDLMRDPAVVSRVRQLHEEHKASNDEQRA